MLRFYNTATRKVETFVPIEEGKVSMYVCGLTVYNDMHLGHARTYIAFDTIRRWFEYLGNDVKFIQNHTDIDDKIIELMSVGKDIFRLNTENLKHANPDLIISQEICQVCSAYTNQVDDAVNILGRRLDVLTINPHDIQGILLTIIDFSKKIDAEAKGRKLVESLTKRINYIKDKKYDKCPTVLAIEWIDPFFTAGHWIPEMIESVGARNLISKKGEHSRKMTFDEIKNANPDIIILMPCGFDVERTIKEYKKNLEKNSKWKTLEAVKRQNVFAVDANSFFSKPSLRTIIGIEILGKIIQSKVFADLMVPVKSYRKIN